MSKQLRLAMVVIMLLGSFSLVALAQKKAKASGIPRVVKFSGALSGSGGAPRTGSASVIFSLYSEQTGGVPLWQETQNVHLDDQGRYNVLLGSSRELPAGIFASGEARWLGVQVLADAEPEQSRFVLVSVPYALKSQDAETLGGRPASAYVLAETLHGLAAEPVLSKRSGSAAAARSLDTGIVSATGGGTVDSIPKFSATDTLVDSIITEKNVSGDLRVGIGMGATNPASKLQINGRMTAEGFDITTSATDSVHIINSNNFGQGIQVNSTSTSGGQSTAVYASAESSNGTAVFAVALPAAGAPTDTSFGVLGFTWNPGAAIMGLAIANDVGGFGGFPSFPETTGMYAGVNSSTAQPLVVQNRHASGTRLISARNSAGTEVVGMTTAGNITATGAITATSFSGSGAGLTGVAASSATTAAALSSDPAACAANRFVTDIAADGTLTCTQPSSANLSDVSTLATKTYADAGDASLAAPGYVALAASSTLTNERVLTAGNGISVTDGGAGTTVTIGNKADFAQTSVAGGDTLSSIPAGGATFATTYVIPANTITVGTVIEVWASGVQLTGAANDNFWAYGVDLNSTSVLTISGSGSGIYQSANQNGYWNLQARLICISVAGTTAAFESSGINFNTKDAGAFGSRNIITGAVVDPTIAQTLSVREFVATGGTNSATMRQLIVKVLK